MPTLDDLHYDANGLIPAIIVDDTTGEVRMLGYMNEAALRKTIETREVHFWSRSRQQLWHKGERSGHVMRVKGILTDICDMDTLVIRVEQVGDATCHLGYRSCFSLELRDDGSFDVVGEKLFEPDDVYGREP
jgi:phosphoribosyl-AMP cyclohydrolase